MNDLEIAQKVQFKPIEEIAARLGVDKEFIDIDHECNITGLM